jgi:hypothetical protein
MNAGSLERMNDLEFVDWAFGNTMDNALRGVVAEYLVHKAVGGIAEHRVNWDAYDVEMPDSCKIEVKTSGYLQEWQQARPSIIQFDIARKDPWIAKENRFVGQKCRYSDIWVFAVHTEQDPELADPFKTDQWQFLVTSARWLDETFGDQKSVRYSVLLGKGLKPVNYSELAREIDKAKASVGLA